MAPASRYASRGDCHPLACLMHVSNRWRRAGAPPTWSNLRLPPQVCQVRGSFAWRALAPLRRLNQMSLVLPAVGAATR